MEPATKRRLSHSLEPAPQWLLTMTATIVPAVNAGVKRADPATRLEDYKRALRYWLNYEHPSANRILFLENSGADLASLEEIADRENPSGKQVEFLSLPGNCIPEGRNYGYTEMELLDEGLAASRLRQQSSHMIKVTGRLTFPTLGAALNQLPTVPEVMVDCRKLGFPRRGYDAYTQLFACSHGFYDLVLRDSRLEMNSTDVRLLEHLIYRKVIPFRGQPGIYLRFPRNIEPVGYSGFRATSYRSPKAVMVRGIRGMFRAVAPNYWF
jgi:hypothetical protein